MNYAKVIENQLSLCGKKCFLNDGEWNSTPFFAAVQQTWRRNKTNFEDTLTPAGLTSADYFIYIGPASRNILNLSEDCRLINEDGKYVFKRRERIEIFGQTVFYWGVLRMIRGEGDE